MSDDLVAVFARIHSDYRTAIAMTVRNLPPDALDAVAKSFGVEEAGWSRPDALRNLSIEGWAVAPRVRIEVRREIKRRAEVAAQESQA